MSLMGYDDVLQLVSAHLEGVCSETLNPVMQVIKTRIQAFDPATRRLQLTLAARKVTEAWG